MRTSRTTRPIVLVAVAAAALVSWPTVAAAAAPAATSVLAATPDVLFPPTLVGNTAAPGNRTIVIRNLATTPVTLAAAVDVPTTALSFSFAKCLGRTLAPRATCPVTVRYQPRVGLADSAAVTLSTADGSSFVVVRASGVSMPRVEFDELALNVDDVRIGATATRTVHVRNTAPGAVTVTAVALGEPVNHYSVAADGCTGTRLPSGAACAVTIAYRPTVSQPDQVTLHVDTTGGAIDLAAYARPLRKLQATPLALAFGSQLVGTTSPRQDVVVTNIQTTPIDVVTDLGPAFPPAFHVVDECAGVVLAVGASCRIGVTFRPTAAGDVRDPQHQLFLNGEGNQLSLTGTGLAQTPATALRITPTLLNFGSFDPDAPPPAQPVTVTNQGSTTVRLNGRVVVGEAEVVDGCTGTALAPGASCTVAVSPRTVSTGGSGDYSVQLKWGVGSASIGLYAQARAQLSVRGMTDLGPAQLGQAVTGTLQIVDTGSAPVTLTGAPPIPTPTGVTVTVTANGCDGVTLQPGDSCPLTVAVTTQTLARTGFVISTWDDYFVDARGVALHPQPWLVADASALDLGTSPTTTPPPPATFTLTNTSPVARSAGVCAVTGPFLVSSTCGVTIGPGASLVVTVRVKVGAGPDATGGLTVTDRATGTTVSVRLRGGDLAA